MGLFHIGFYPNWVENIDMVIISFSALVKYGFTVPIFTKLTVSQLHCTEFHTHWPRNMESMVKNLFTLLSMWANFHETSACILTVCK
jgi:hypothetical protein